MSALLSYDRLSAIRAPSVALPVVGLIGGVGLGALSAYRLSYGAVALVIAVLAVATIYRPANLAIMAVVGVFAVQRLGSASIRPGSGGGVSYSDALLAAATVLAIPAVAGSGEFRRQRMALTGLGIYLACLLPTVFLHASTRGYLEWTHRLVLIGGSLVVGAWIARERLTVVALRWLTVVACLVAIAAVANTINNNFLPASPLGLHKNFIGSLFGAIIVLVAVAPTHLGLSQRIQVVALLMLGVGLLASQSRGGMLAAVAGMLIAFNIDPRAHSRRIRALSVLVALVLAAFAFLSIRSQLNQTQADSLNGSLGVRFNVEKVTRDVWRTSPVDGVGLKYFNTGEFGRNVMSANNVVDNELAESGVIGLVGFVLLQGTVLAAGTRRRRSGTLVAAGVAVVVGQLLHGMVDIYWNAGVITLPFLILGIGLAAEGGEDQLASRRKSGRVMPPVGSVAREQPNA